MIAEFGFVIVNYNTYEDTRECICSIQENVIDNYIIVVVDNASPDGSGNKLKEAYCKDEKCIVFLNDKNDGYAKANNIGINICRNKFGSHFVCILNPDIRIIQKNFTDIVKQEFIEKNYEVLSGVILDKKQDFHGKSHQGNNIISIESLHKRKARVKVYLNILPVYYLISWIKEKITDNQNKKPLPMPDEYHHNVQLPGCFLVLSPEFFKHQKELFDGTFMFMEEEILYYQVMKREGITLFSPRIRVTHKSGISRGSGIEKLRFTLVETIRSMDNIIKYMEKEANI